MTESSSGAKLGLDALLLQLIDRAQDVRATQGRLRGLLRANQAVVANLSLPVLLHEVVEAACELSHARYGALGVLDGDGGLAEFVTVGVDAETAAVIGPLPTGKGLLGALIEDPRPIRLRHMSDDVRSSGFPPQHPHMDSFLGVPVRVRGVVFGHLYLAERDDHEFTAEDEELVLALAATAGVAIENARLYADAERKQGWLQASTEVTRQLLSVDGEDPFQVIASRARQVADADLVAVLLPTGDGEHVAVEVAHGDGAHELAEHSLPLRDSLVGLALETGRPVLVSDAQADRRLPPQVTEGPRIGPAMALPLGGAAGGRGALVIGRTRGRHRFTEADLEMATVFAGQAALALELADARTDQQRISLLEDRDRIARDLHDHVIQRLFAVGLTVQSVSGSLSGGPLADRLDRVVSDLDDTIRQTRTTIFALAGAAGPETGTVRSRLLDVVADITPALGTTPRLRFSGPVDTVVPEDLVPDLVAVLREALTNVARHADARRVDVDVDVDVGAAGERGLSVRVVDDGVGVPAGAHRSGLANLRHRAERHGGQMSVAVDAPEAKGSRGSTDAERRTRGGTAVTWTVPLP